MTFTLMVILKATILLAAAGLLAFALKPASASLRHLIWLVALVSLILLPVAVWLTPAWTPEVTLSMPATATTRTVINVVAGRSWSWPSLSMVLVALYAAGAAVVLYRTVASYWAMDRVARRAKPMPVDRAEEVRLSPETSVPLVCGLRHPVILLPAAAGTWPDERLRVVLAHEAMHIERSDLKMQLLAQATCILYWFHPLVWWAASQLRLECEQACDDGVLAQGERASVYAGHLVEIVRGITAEPRTEEGAIAMARTTDLEHRVRALFQPNRNRRGAGPRLLAVASLGAALLLVPLAALRAPAQTGGSPLAGTVKDASGATVPKASVTIVLMGTDRKEFALTNDVGEFSFSPVPDGRYKITVAKPGFALATLEGVEHSSAKPQQLSLILAIGKVQETVNVVGDRPAAATRATSNTSPATPSRIKVGGNVQATKMITRVNPAYPPDCKAEGIEGTVLLRTVVSREGLPLSLEPINQLVDKRLVDSAIAAVKQWRYQPTLLNGEPVEIITEVQVNYTLMK